MPTPIEAAVQRATEKFARELLDIFRGAVLGDVLPEKTTRGPSTAPRVAKSAGRSKPEYGDVLLVVLKAAKDGLTSEEIQLRSGWSKEKIRREAEKLIAAGSVKKRGKARGTRYFAA